MAKTYSVAGILWILALGGTLQGFETSSMAVFIGSEKFLDYFNNPGPIIQGIICGSNPAGAFIGCWVAGLFSDAFGRVVSMQVGSVLWIIGSVISILVTDVWMVMLGRAIKGITIGIFSSILPVYVSEVIKQESKGLATSIMQWCLTWGILIMFYTSYLTNFLTGTYSFRVAWAIELVPGTLLFLLSFLLPESPKWLASKSKWREAAYTMQRLTNTPPDDDANNSKANDYSFKENAETETLNQNKKNQDLDEPANQNSNDNLQEMEEVLDNFENQARRCTYGDLFRKDLRTHLALGIFMQSVTQLSGIGVLMYYLIFICEMVGLTGNVKVLSASIQYVVNVVFTIIPILWLDNLRRIDVIVYGSFCLGLCIGTIGIVMGVYGHGVPPLNGNESVVWEITGTPGSICLALCFLFVAIFASTLSCAAWLYTNEIFPSRAKAKGSAICMSVSWTLNFILTFLAPLCLQYLKWGTFLMFGAFCICGSIIIGLLFPETHGLSEEDIDGLFRNPQREADIELENQPRETNVQDSGNLPILLDNESTLTRDQTLSRSVKMVQTPQTRLAPPSTIVNQGSLSNRSIKAFNDDPAGINKVTKEQSLTTKHLANSFEEVSHDKHQPENEKPLGTPHDTEKHYYDMGSDESPFFRSYKNSPSDN